MLLAPFRMLVNFVGCILVGLGTLGLGFFQMLGWMVITTVGHMVVAATNIRIFYKADQCNNVSNLRGTGFAIGTVACCVSLIFALVCLSSSGPTHKEALEMWANASANVPYLGAILVGLLITNVASLLYEVGRMNGGRVFNSESEEETEDLDGVDEDLPEVPDLENALDAMDKLEKIEEMTKEFAAEWFKKIEEMLKNGVIDPAEANSLMVAVENRLPAAEKSRS